MWKFQADKIVNCLFFGAPSFSNKPKLGLKVRLQAQNFDLFITIYNTCNQRKLTAKGMSTIKYENVM